MGAAISSAALHRFDPTRFESTTRWIDALIAQIAEQPLEPCLQGGLFGATWTLAHLLGPAVEELGLDEVDEIACVHVERLRAAELGHRLRIDHTHGLIGVGVYALERRSEPAARACIEQIVTILAECAIDTPAGIAWANATKWEPERGWYELPAGFINYGMAHGVPGAIAWLAGVLAHDSGDSRVRAMLTSAVESLRAAAILDVDGMPTYPSRTGPGQAPEPCRVGWCYGDLGVATALFTAGRALAEPTIERDALALARRAGRRSLAEAQVDTPGICHGACGNALMLQRLHHASGDPELARLAATWFEHGLELLDESDQLGLLEGACGILLALLAAIDERPPSWDRYLSLSIQPALPESSR
ncbi:lanthionine synthetase LanC family protein [Nannocystaceae bacterium ST9]